MDDLGRIDPGSGHLSEDDEKSGRRVRPRKGTPVPSGAIDFQFFRQSIEFRGWSPALKGFLKYISQVSSYVMSCVPSLEFIYS